MKRNISENIFRTLEDGEKDYKWENHPMGIIDLGKGIFFATCLHCGIQFKNKKGKVTTVVDGHILDVNPNNVSFYCPCHNGWFLDLYKNEILKGKQSEKDGYLEYGIESINKIIQKVN